MHARLQNPAPSWFLIMPIGEMSFIYSSVSKDIVTFLPPDAPETADWRGSQVTALSLISAP